MGISLYLPFLKCLNLKHSRTPHPLSADWFKDERKLQTLTWIEWNTFFFSIFWTVILQNLIRREFCTVFLYQIAQIHYTNDLKQNDVALMILKYEFHSTSDETLFALDVNFIMWWTNVFFAYIYWIEWTDKIVGARKNRLLFRKRTKCIQTALKERNCGKTCNIEIIIH